MTIGQDQRAADANGGKIDGLTALQHRGQSCARIVG
jgi:glutamine phosphoribosylpyrophosphate amidotransferase